jgi:DNA polymerase-3 subunit delta
MIYVIEGQEEYFIRERINKIISENEGEVSRFDSSDKSFSIDIMLEACQGNSLFSQGSIVLVNEPYFLIKKIDDNEYNVLEKYINNPIYECQLILFTYNNNFNSRLKAYKMVSHNAENIVLNSLDYKNFNSYVKSRINEEKLNISSDAAYLLNNLCKRSATLFNRNIEILKLFPEQITPVVVAKLCSRSDDNESFDLINALTDKDLSKAILLERKMLSDNDSALSVISLLAGQLRFLYQIAYYNSIGMNKRDIINQNNINEYRYDKAVTTLNKLSMNQIITLLKDLSDLDIAAKSDYSLKDNERFEMFIVRMCRKEGYAGN